VTPRAAAPSGPGPENDRAAEAPTGHDPPAGPDRSPRRADARRPLRTAAIAAIGSELTTGATRDTNAAELAAALTAEGVDVVGIALLPDDFATVVAALRTALAGADLVVTTGGLGPTPDDLTREAIAAVFGEEPVVDRRLEAALRRRWRRRGLPYPASNVKQAWLIPSARPIPNPNGTAPGWWVERPDGRLVIALPGPPRELRPMWRDWVLGRLRRRGLGRRQLVRTLRTVGIGESQLVELLGEALLRKPNPRLATYARQDAVDVVIVARDEPAPAGRRGRRAATLLADAEALVRARLGEAVWGTDGDTWASVVGRLLEERTWRLALAELGTAGRVVDLLEPLAVDGHLVRAEVEPPTGATDIQALVERAAAVRTAAAVEVGLAVTLVRAGADTRVAVAIADPLEGSVEVRTVFGTGAQARLRAAVVAADVLRRRLLAAAGPPDPDEPAGP
jgi:nicotinamide-nucleotide amidase